MGVNLSALSISASSSMPRGSRPKGLWGVSPLYVNPVNMLNILIKILADDKGGTARDRLKEV